jgi:hypothetical protein
MLLRIRKSKKGLVYTCYYYNGYDPATGKQKEYPLGTDFELAKQKWAQFEAGTYKPIPAPRKFRKVISRLTGKVVERRTRETWDIAWSGRMKEIFDRYEHEVVTKKAPRTQKDNFEQIKMLRKVFDNAPIDSITPQHIAQYRDRRRSVKDGSPAPVRANREISLFSHIFNMAREWGYTAKENPCRGVRKNKENPRDYYADDTVWYAVYKHAKEELKDAMDLAYLAAQRPADVIKIKESDIQGNALFVKQNKTTRKLRIVFDNDDGTRNQLGQLIDRIRARKVRSMYLISTPDGQRVTKGMLRLRYDKARKDAYEEFLKAGDIATAERIMEFQFRDIRPKAASEIESIDDASGLLGHTKQDITKKVYIRVGKTVKPTR